MRSCKTIIAILLTFAYPLAAGYCLLENANLVPTIHCCAETASQHHDENAPCGYGCCPIEYAVYSSLDSGVIDFIAPPTDLVLFEVIPLLEFPAEAPAVLLEHSPPEILKSWQFSFRTALPPRAPSIVS